MNITLTNDLLLIRRLPDEEPVTAWGFVLPATDEHVDTPLRGLVLAAGPGRTPKLAPAGAAVVRSLERIIELAGEKVRGWPAYDQATVALAAQESLPERRPMQVQVGDIVIFSKHGFQEFRIEGEDLIVTQEASILGVIESDRGEVSYCSECGATIYG